MAWLDEVTGTDLAYPRGDMTHALIPLDLGENVVRAYVIETFDSNDLVVISTETSFPAITFGWNTTFEIHSYGQSVIMLEGNTIGSADGGFFVKRTTSDWRGLIWDESADVWAAMYSATEPVSATNYTVTAYSDFRAKDFTGNSFVTSTYVQLAEQGSDPGAIANAGRLYTKDVTTVTQLFYQASDGTVYQVTPGGGATAHSSLTGLTVGDDHTQYVLLAGRSGGQTIIGGTAASNSLTLESTAHATKGSVLIKDSDVQLNSDAAAGTSNGATFTMLDGDGGTTLVRAVFNLDAPNDVISIRQTDNGAEANTTFVVGHLTSVASRNTQFMLRAGNGSSVRSSEWYLDNSGAAYFYTTTTFNINSNTKFVEDSVTVGRSDYLVEIENIAGAYTSTPHLMLLDMATATSITTASDVYGIRGLGKAVSGGGNAVGISLDANWGVGLEVLSTRTIRTGAQISIGQGTYSAPGTNSIAIFTNGVSNLGGGRNIVIGEALNMGSASYTDNVLIGSVNAGSNTVTNSFSVGIGYRTKIHARAVAVGDRAEATGSDAVAIGGSSPKASGTRSIAIGYTAVCSGVDSIAIGTQHNTNLDNVVAIGRGSTPSATGQVIFGGSAGATSYNYKDLYLGAGVTAQTVPNSTINATGGSGNDVTGGNLAICGGKGTGNKMGGVIDFQSTLAGGTGPTLRSLVSIAKYVPDATENSFYYQFGSDVNTNADCLFYERTDAAYVAATTANLCEFTPQNDYGGTAEFNVVGCKATGTEKNVYVLRVKWHKTAGSVTRAALTSGDIVDEDATTWNASVETAGGKIYVTVNSGSDNVNWSVYVRWHEARW